MTTAARLLTALAAASALALAACSDGGDADPTPSASTPTPAPSTTAPSASATPSSDPGPSAGGDDARGIPRTSDVVVTAVTGECTYVRDDALGETLALRGDLPRPLEVGDLVRVTGGGDDTPYEACPDGLPFLVSTVEDVP